MRDYKNIKAYQLADKFVLNVYKITKNFPKEEIYGLTAQLRRAAISVPANIVEGASRQHKKDYLNFLFTSRGSLSEAEYLLNLAKNLEYISSQGFLEIDQIRLETAKTLIEAVSNEI